MLEKLETELIENIVNLLEDKKIFLSLRLVCQQICLKTASISERAGSTPWKPIYRSRAHRG